MILLNPELRNVTKSDLAKKVDALCHLKNGNFLLRSGEMSSEYFDKYKLESQPDVLMALAFKMKELIPVGTEVLAGLEMGGIPIATALSILTGIPVCFVRKEAKTYGTCQFAEGAPVANKKVCVIEDVITSGGQVILSTADLRNNGAHIHHILCIINRGEQKAIDALKEHHLKLSSLFVKSDF